MTTPFPILEAIKRQPCPEYPPAMMRDRLASIIKQLREEQASSDGTWKSDPDTVDGESIVSQWEDERNSRPFPY